MLELKINSMEIFDENTEEFINIKPVVLQLEHSLISISKWESKWHKPFLMTSNNMTRDEIIDYIRCMTISPGNIDDRVYYLLSQDHVDSIVKYIDDPMTATWFSTDKNKNVKNKEIITSELIYYWMIALQIPFECQKWHLNRLLTLVKVCNAKNEESQGTTNKLSKRDLMSRNAALNAQRRAQLHSKG